MPKKVVLLGDSMGGTAALRFARHADAVVAFVPQVDLRDFPAPCDRVDFDDARRERGARRSDQARHRGVRSTCAVVRRVRRSSLVGLHVEAISFSRRTAGQRLMVCRTLKRGRF